MPRLQTESWVSVKNSVDTGKTAAWPLQRNSSEIEVYINLRLAYNTTIQFGKTQPHSESCQCNPSSSPCEDGRDQAVNIVNLYMGIDHIANLDP
jgi:hypothetical protein